MTSRDSTNWPPLGEDIIDDSLVIGSASILSLEFGKIRPGTNQSSLVFGSQGSLSSDDFVSGTSGIFLSGATSELNDVIVRGTLVAGTGSDVGFDVVTAGTNTAALVVGGSGTVQSSNYSAGTAGWRILGDGSAELNNVTVRGTLSTSSLTGSLTLGTGGVFRTAASGKRIEIATTTSDRILFYSGNASETAPGRLLIAASSFELVAPVITGVLGETGSITWGSSGMEFQSGLSGVTSQYTFKKGASAVGAARVTLENSTSAYASVVVGGLTLGDGFSSAGLTTSNVLVLGTTSTSQLQVAQNGYFAGAWGGHTASFNGWFKVPDGTAALPGIMFGNDTDTGFARFVANEFKTVLGGTIHSKVQISGNEKRIYLGDASGDFIAYDTSLDQYKFYIGGNAVIIQGSAGTLIPGVWTSNVTSSTMFVQSDGRIGRNTSMRAKKKNIRPITDLADLELNPVGFQFKVAVDPSGLDMLGFIAEDLFAQDPRLTVVEDDGTPSDLRERAILAVLAAKVNRLESRMEAAS